MRATGIVRRMDDLGRVVIPKELRKQLRLREGAPLEIFTHNGAVCFKPYVAIGAKDWERVAQMVEIILPCDFVITDSYGDIQGGSSSKDSIENAKEFGVVVEGETVAYIAIAEEDAEPIMETDIPKAIKVLQKLFANEG